MGLLLLDINDLVASAGVVVTIKFGIFLDLGGHSQDISIFTCLEDEVDGGGHSRPLWMSRIW